MALLPFLGNKSRVGSSKTVGVKPVMLLGSLNGAPPACAGGAPDPKIFPGSGHQGVTSRE